MTEHIENIHFDYLKCEHLGFSASIIMGVIISAVDDYRIKKGIKCNYEENVSMEKRSREILLASELKADEKKIERFV